MEHGRYSYRLFAAASHLLHTLLPRFQKASIINSFTHFGFIYFTVRFGISSLKCAKLTSTVKSKNWAGFRFVASEKVFLEMELDLF